MMINMYDEENVDLETELYNREIMEEQEQEHEQNNEESEIENEEENINEDIKVNKNTLIYAQKVSPKKRKSFIFIHKPTNIIYEGELLGQDINNSDKFCFSVKVYKSEENKKIRIFKYQDLKNIRYK